MQLPIPGCQVIGGGNDSDSDPEAVAARKEHKEKQIEQLREQEKREDEAKARAAEYYDSIKDKEQIIESLFPKEDIQKIMSSIGCERPEELEERIDLATKLSDTGKELLQQNELDKARAQLLGALHCVDFTPAQQTDLNERKLLAERSLPTVATVLQRLSHQESRSGNPRKAYHLLDVGVDVLRKVPYKDNKDTFISMRLRMAHVKAELRDFKGAKEEAAHVLRLQPGHEQATLITQNSNIAAHLEKLPEDQRWKGPISKQVRVKQTQKEPPKNKPNIIVWSVVVVFIAILAALYLRRA